MALRSSHLSVPRYLLKNREHYKGTGRQLRELRKRWRNSRNWRLVFVPQGITTFGPARAEEVPVHPRNDFELDFLGANGFALPDVRATAEQFLFHPGHHAQHAQIAFRLALWEQAEMADLGSGEQSGRGVRAGGHTGAAPNARSSIHCEIGVFLGDQDSIAVRRAARDHGDESAGGNDAIEGASIHHPVLHYRKRASPPWFEIKNIAILEMTHVKLAHRGSALGSVSDAVDHESAHAADPFPAIVVERNWLFTLRDEFLVEDVEHLQERHVGIHALVFVLNHAARVTWILLPPHMKGQLHYL